MHPLAHLYGFHVHVVLSIIGFFGVFLFYHWAKTLPSRRQLHLALVTMGIGVIGVFLTVQYCLIGLRLMQAQ